MKNKIEFKLNKSGKYVLVKEKKQKITQGEVLPFTGKTDEEHFSGQSWFESAKQQSDIDCLIESKIDFKNDGE